MILISDDVDDDAEDDAESVRSRVNSLSELAMPTRGVTERQICAGGSSAGEGRAAGGTPG